MRTSILPLVACALVLPSCTLLFNQDRHWRDGGGVAVDAGVDAFVEPDAFVVPDADLDAFVVRPMPTRPVEGLRTISLNCTATPPSIIYQDPADSTQDVGRLEESFASFRGWSSFAMLANGLQIGDSEAANTIPSHAIWLEHPARDPHVTWLNPSPMTPGTYQVGWDRGGGNAFYTSGTENIPFVVANQQRFLVGGGPTLRLCSNGENPTDCVAWPDPLTTERKWGGFAFGEHAGDRIIRARQNGSMVAFPESASPSAGYANAGLLRQPTGDTSSALYSDSTLFVFGAGSTGYSVSVIDFDASITSAHPRVSYDGSRYFRATIDTSLTVAVSDCTDTSCGVPDPTIITLPGEVLVDWTFHALSESARVAVLLTRDDAAPIALGTHVSVAVWHAGDATAVPLRIASGRFTPLYGEGRSVESVAELSGAQLDVYVSTLVNLQNGAIEEDRIYLSGFRLCL